MPRHWIRGFLFAGAVTFVGLTFAGPALAQDCGGDTPCNCGDSVVADRDVRDDPVSGVCPAGGLIIATSGVTVRLGKMLGSPDPHATRTLSDGVVITANNVTLVGGRIEGFQHGIYAKGTSASTISGVSAQHNAVNGIYIEGNSNLIEFSDGHHNLGNDDSGTDAEDGILVVGYNNDLIESTGEKTVEFFSGIRVMGTGNYLRKNFVRTGPGNGIWVTGDNNIDGGSNKGQKKITGPIKCEIDGNPCQ